MPIDALRWLVQFGHVFCGILWFGGGFYTTLVQLPALMKVPLEQRGPAVAAIAPRQLRYLLRVAELTIALGIVSAFLTGRLANVSAVATSLWGWAIGIGAVLAIGLYVLMQAGVKPAIFRMLAVGRQVAAGDRTAAAEVPALVARVRTLGYVQIGVGAVVVLLMVAARLS